MLTGGALQGDLVTLLCSMAFACGVIFTIFAVLLIQRMLKDDEEDKGSVHD